MLTIVKANVNKFNQTYWRSLKDWSWTLYYIYCNKIKNIKCLLNLTIHDCIKTTTWLPLLTHPTFKYTYSYNYLWDHIKPLSARLHLILLPSLLRCIKYCNIWLSKIGIMMTTINKISKISYICMYIFYLIVHYIHDYVCTL